MRKADDMVVPDRQFLREEGRRLLQAGELDASIGYLKRVLEIDPADAKALIYIGAAYSQKGEIELAIPAFEQAAQLNPSSKSLYNLGLAYEQVGRIAAARAAYLYALDLNPEYTPATEAVERLGPPTESETVTESQPREPFVEEIPQPEMLQEPEDFTFAEEFPVAAQQIEETEEIAEPQAFTQDWLTEPEPEFEQPAPEAVPVYPCARSLHRTMIKSGVFFGALIGIVWAGVMFLLLPTLILPDGASSFGTVPMIVGFGLVIGAIIGFFAGLTGGGSETGLRIGAAMGFVEAIFFIVAGRPAGVASLLVIVVGVVIGALGGYLIGYTADSSISRRLPG